jgi:hypothetical protein
MEVKLRLKLCARTTGNSVYEVGNQLNGNSIMLVELSKVVGVFTGIVSDQFCGVACFKIGDKTIDMGYQLKFAIPKNSMLIFAYLFLNG